MSIEYPAIIVFPRSIGDRRYIANSHEDVAKICHDELIKRVHNLKYWRLRCADPDRRKNIKMDEVHACMTTDEHAYVELSDEDVKALPAPVRVLAEAARAEYAQKTLEIEGQYFKDNEFDKGLSRVLDAGEDGWMLKNDKDQYLCIDLVLSRRHEHDEGIEIQYVTRYTTKSGN